jgi:hypothetical protein
MNSVLAFLPELERLKDLINKDASFQADFSYITCEETVIFKQREDDLLLNIEDLQL